MWQDYQVGNQRRRNKGIVTSDFRVMTPAQPSGLIASFFMVLLLFRDKRPLRIVSLAIGFGVESE
jgi:hypothetical protein